MDPIFKSEVANCVSQLAEAQEALSNATKASNDHTEATRKRAEAFKAQQADIDRRLKAITRSDASDQAAQRFEVSIQKLRKLEISKGYVALLQEAEKLRYLNYGEIVCGAIADAPYTARMHWGTYDRSHGWLYRRIFDCKALSGH